MMKRAVGRGIRALFRLCDAFSEARDLAQIAESGGSIALLRRRMGLPA
jgi:hypothetical protein